MTKSKKKNSDGTVIIKKYANRRLYDTSTSSYVTLDHLSDLVRRGVEFEVRDAKTGEDLTRTVLTQIIFEKETKGDGALPLNFLRQLIGFYGGGAQNLLPAWLDMSMNAFAESQERMRSALGGANPMAMFEKQAQRNAEMFENAMRVFVPNMGPRDAEPERRDSFEEEDEEEDKGAFETPADPLSALKVQMEMMQAQLEALAKTQKK